MLAVRHEERSAVQGVPRSYQLNLSPVSMNKNSLLFCRIVENRTPVTLILDRDAKKKALKIAEELHEYSVPVKINFPDGDQDLNDTSVDRIEQLIQEAKQYDYNFKLKLKLGSFRL